MSLFYPPFFQSNEYFIDEKVRFFKFHNHYNVFDGTGLKIGSVIQRVPGWHKFFRLFLDKQIFPFHLQIIDSSENILVTIERGWTFWMSKVTICDSHGLVIGYIKQKFKVINPEFRIFNSAEIEVGSITGDWKAWNFEIHDHNGHLIGTVTKKWAGAVKEILTSADKYRVSIVPAFAEDINKINVVSTAIFIDMVLKEGK